MNVIGNRLIAESGDSKSKKFLFERISLAIQRGNAASIRGTFLDSAILSEIFVLHIKPKCYVFMLLIYREIIHLFTTYIFTILFLFFKNTMQMCFLNLKFK
jgi:hypothetical protein